MKPKTFARKLAKAKLIADRCNAASVTPAKWVQHVLKVAKK